MLRDALFLARKDLRYMFRARETWLWTFVMPVAFFYFIGTVTGGFSGRPGGKEEITVVVPADAGFLAGRLVRGLEARNYQVVETGSRRRLEIPAGFTQSVMAGQPVKVTLTRTSEGLGAEYDQARVARAVYTLLAELIVTGKEGGKASPEALDKLAREPRHLSLEVRAAGKRILPPSGFEQAVPGTLVMFTMLVLFTSGGVTLVIERSQGILRRLASSPMSRGAVVLGKWGARWTLALIQIAFAMLAGRVLFQVSWGPHLPAVMAALAVYAGLVASLGILLANLATSREQCIGAGVIASNVMAGLGGCWWPIEITPVWAQKLALFLPAGWAMDALHQLVSFGAGPAAVLPHLAWMAAAGLLAGWLVS
ncbi:MAG: ABC transporter permease, partial [Acidobacteria bacterium]|nr:ABC transporter permease [Acidobacteriota bacterium]